METCIECGKRFRPDQYNFWCEQCGTKNEKEFFEDLGKGIIGYNPDGSFWEKRVHNSTEE